MHHVISLSAHFCSAPRNVAVPFGPRIRKVKQAVTVAIVCARRRRFRLTQDPALCEASTADATRVESETNGDYILQQHIH